MTEKDTLLALATPDRWWEWADDPIGWRAKGRGCLLCLAYQRGCAACKIAGGHDPDSEECWGNDVSAGQKATARLIRAGVEKPAAYRPRQEATSCRL